MFLIFFHLIYDCSAFCCSKKVGQMLVDWVEWYSVYFVGLTFFNHTFNLFINNIVRKPIIDESLFYVFYLFIKYCFRGGDQFWHGISGY